MKELVNMIKKHEGFRGKPYLCTANKMTVGYGRNIDDVGFSIEEIRFLGLDKKRDFNLLPISKYEAEVLLYNDIYVAKKECLKLDINFKTLDKVRQDVIVDMMFNLGFGRLSKFKRTLQYLKERRYDDTAVEMLNSKWARQVYRRANELSKMIETGSY